MANAPPAKPMHRPTAVPRYPAMLAFLDFEASSLGKHSFPVEVAWVFEDGRSAAYLIRPAPEWQDWDPRAEAIHRIPRSELDRAGTPHDAVAQAMIEALAGHDLTASAPSWDGKWLSTLLRAAGLPRHALRLRDTEAAQRETAAAILRDHVPPEALAGIVDAIVANVSAATHRERPAHRALADAEVERDRWIAVRDAALRRREYASSS